MVARARRLLDLRAGLDGGEHAVTLAADRGVSGSRESSTEIQMVDVRHLNVAIDLVVGARARLANPLGTSFDLADVLACGVTLASSPFLEVWSKETDRKLEGVHGLWVVSTDTVLEICMGPGRRTAVGRMFEHLQPETLARSLFFEVPEAMADIENASLRLTLVCMD